MRDRSNRNESKIFDHFPTPEEIERAKNLRQKFSRSLQTYAARCLVVIDRDGTGKSNFIPFRFNAAQLYLHNLIKQIREFNKVREQAAGGKQKFPVQMVELKARKVGWSTYIQARAFHACEFRRGTNTLTMAHELAAAENIMRISRRYVDHFRVPLAMPDIARKNPGLLEWTDKHDSRIIVKTAGNKTGGSSRSFTWNFVHISEEAHFKESDEVAAAMAAKSSVAESHEESTAKGIGGMFFENWKNAMWLEDAVRLWKAKEAFPAGWNGKFRAFWPWIADPNYRETVMKWEEKGLLASLSPREEELIKTHKCDLGQIKWRRMKIAGECAQQKDMDPEEYFNQEYPTTPEDAFVSKGKNVFPSGKLNKMLMAAGDRKPVGKFVFSVNADAKEDDLSKVVHMREAKVNPQYTVWAEPRAFAEYVMGVDTAEGKLHGDNSTIRIWDRMDGTHLQLVASVAGKIVPDELALVAVFLAQKYNDAFIVPEFTGVGIATCLKLLRLRYPHVFHHDNPVKLSEDHAGEEFTIGFRTLQNTKRLLVSHGQDALRNDQLLICDIEGLEEWLHYQNEDGEYGAPPGEKDDRLMADLLAIYGHFSGKAPTVKMRQAVRVDDKVVENWEEVFEAKMQEKIKKLIAKARKSNAAKERASGRKLGQAADILK